MNGEARQQSDGEAGYAFMVNVTRGGKGVLKELGFGCFFFFEKRYVHFAYSLRFEIVQFFLLDIRFFLMYLIIEELESAILISFLNFDLNSLRW